MQIYGYTWPRLAAESHRAEAAAAAAGAAEARLCLLRQYLYFCTSKASKLSTSCVRVGVEAQAVGRTLACGHICTSSMRTLQSSMRTHRGSRACPAMRTHVY